MQVIIALVVTTEGYPLAYEVLSGNTSDKTTLKRFLEKIEKLHGKANRVWVMDRGIPTEAALEQMQASDPPVHYLVGTPKARLNKLEEDLLKLPWQQARASVRVKLLPQDKELYVFIESRDRLMKERAMRLRKLRLDRYRQWRKREGRYLLRTNLTETDPKVLWEYYLQLVEVEAAFKNLKDDLSLRPIFHQKESRIEAHIFVSFLAYCLSVTLRGHLRKLAGGLTARAVLEKFAALQMVDAHFPTSDGRTLVFRRHTHPDKDQKNLLAQLGWELPEQPPPASPTKVISWNRHHRNRPFGADLCRRSLDLQGFSYASPLQLRKSG